MPGKETEKPFLPYIVKKTDFLTKLAYRYGFDADQIWEHKKNQSTNQSRNDCDVLCSGDLLFFPRKEPKSMVFRAGETNQYTASPPEIDIHLQFSDADGPLSLEPYRITNLGEEISGSTGTKGELSLRVPILTETITICFDRLEHEETVMVGRLDPINTLSGVEQRLDALGFCDLANDDHTGEALALAILRFQECNNLPATARLDLDTVQQILVAFGR